MRSKWKKHRKVPAKATTTARWRNKNKKNLHRQRKHLWTRILPPLCQKTEKSMRATKLMSPKILPRRHLRCHHQRRRQLKTKVQQSTKRKKIPAKQKPKQKEEANLPPKNLLFH